jgi:hypothetical protein
VWEIGKPWRQALTSLRRAADGNREAERRGQDAGPATRSGGRAREPGQAAAGSPSSSDASGPGTENIGQCPVGSSRNDHSGPTSSANHG